jgi:hypothetical protein
MIDAIYNIWLYFVILGAIAAAIPVIGAIICAFIDISHKKDNWHG